MKYHQLEALPKSGVVKKQRTEGSQNGAGTEYWSELQHEWDKHEQRCLERTICAIGVNDRGTREGWDGHHHHNQ